MQLQQSQIINLAVNIFQNVGIKRYIGQIEALRHEDIYFQIYKIIFPHSMINIFKISESNLTTGQKIQKIIEQISSIIKLDLYHISGQAIAQGNRNHLTNWLQLLEALSNNCVAYQTFQSGGSAPDRDREMYREFEEDDYYTVQGVNDQFEKHVYTDEKPDEGDDPDQPKYRSSNKNQNNNSFNPPLKKQKQHHSHSHNQNQNHHNHHNHHNYQKQSSSEKGQSQLNKSFRKSQSSRNSNVLKPVQPNKKNSGKVKNVGKKKVTFKIDQAQIAKNNIKNAYKNQKKGNEEKRTATSLQPLPNGTGETKIRINWPEYGLPNAGKVTDQEIILRKKKSFILKMHKIVQEMQRKKINDQIAKFQSWAYHANQQSLRNAVNIEQQNRMRTRYINKKIAEREQFVNSLSGKQAACANIKELFKKQKQNQRRMRKVMRQEQIKDALELMDLGFAAEVENMVMASIGQ